METIRQQGRDSGRGKAAKRLLKKTHKAGLWLMSAIINEGEGRRSGSVKKGQKAQVGAEGRSRKSGSVDEIAFGLAGSKKKG